MLFVALVSDRGIGLWLKNQDLGWNGTGCKLCIFVGGVIHMKFKKAWGVCYRNAVVTATPSPFLPPSTVGKLCYLAPSQPPLCETEVLSKAGL